MSASIGVPFPFFGSLIREISTQAPRSAAGKKSYTAYDYPARKTFHKWVNALRDKFSPLPPDTTANCFRLLFPEEDVRRRYDIQETRMCQLLVDALGISARDFDKWASEESSGCLGEEVRCVMNRYGQNAGEAESPFSIAQVDALLTELAAKSSFSHDSVRSKHKKATARPRSAIVRELFRSLTPFDAGVVVQIILKDLQPLLYPVKGDMHYSMSLKFYNSLSVKMLTRDHAMYVWDPSGEMVKCYRVTSSLEEASHRFDLPCGERAPVKPRIGSRIAIPKSEKGFSCEDALQCFSSPQTVWCETKYDGERAQIHVAVAVDGSSTITIFSKSGRNSTYDRFAVHDIIRTALGLQLSHTSAGMRASSCRSKIRTNVILDAEMVPFDGDRIEEFWRIRQLIKDTAVGPRSSKRWRTKGRADDLQQGSMQSQENEHLSLGLVFFDVLFLDSDSLLFEPYSYRRRKLESIITVTPGEAILAERFPVDMNSSAPEKALHSIFEACKERHEEGLVLKADDSQYNDFRNPWVKLKKDYIPGYGDTLDLVILGASWDKVRGRSLRVPPSTFTTFYVGAPTDKEWRNRPDRRPTFHVYFTVCYGLRRDALEQVNFMIKSAETLSYSEYKNGHDSKLPFALTVYEGFSVPPSVILKTPLLVELFGAGFTKGEGSDHYELRFPRITKVYRPSERDWKDSVDLGELHRIACKSVGRDPEDKEIEDWCNEIWGKASSTKVTPRVDQDRGSPCKRKILDTYFDNAENHFTDQNGDLRKRQCKVKEEDLKPLSQISRYQSSPPCAGGTGGSQSLPLAPVTNLAVTRLPTPQPTPLPAEKAVGPPAGGCEPCLIPLAGFVWFSQPTGGSSSCATWKKWRKQVPQDRRLHSLDSLLFGCNRKDVDGECPTGYIILDECGAPPGWTESILRKLNGHVVVYGCSKKTEPIISVG